MTDMVSKNEGTSRFLRGPADILTKYPTWEAAAAAFAAGLFTVDFAGINPAGVQTQGTKLNKANLLTDATAAALGLTGESNTTVNGALEKLRQLINAAQTGVDNGVKTAIVSYTGTGKSGTDNPCSLTFSFMPTVILCLIYTGEFGPGAWTYSLGTSSGCQAVIPSIMSTSYQRYTGFCGGDISSSFAKKSTDGKTIYWFNSNSSGNGARYQLNYSGWIYFFFAVGS